MKMNKLMKKGRIIFALALLCMFSGMFSLKVSAANYAEKEPNNSASEAQLVFANEETPADFVSGTKTRFNTISGSLSAGDEDWYKVSFLRGTNDNTVYLDMAAGNNPIFIEIFNSDLQPLGNFEYRKSSQQTFEIDSTGQSIYYIKLHQTSTASQSYKFTFGKPKYKYDSYTHRFTTTTLAAKGTWQDTVDLSAIHSIPEDAIGYEIFIGGCTSSVSSKRYFSNQLYTSWVATSPYEYTYKLPVTDASRIAQSWRAKLISTSTARNTITPIMTIRYVTPDIR